MNLTRIAIARRALALSREAFATAPQIARRANAIATAALTNICSEAFLAKVLQKLSH